MLCLIDFEPGIVVRYDEALYGCKNCNACRAIAIDVYERESTDKQVACWYCWLVLSHDVSNRQPLAFAPSLQTLNFDPSCHHDINQLDCSKPLKHLCVSAIHV